MMRSTLGGALVVIFITILVSLPSTGVAEDDVKVLRTISFDSEAKIRQAVKDECKIETDVPHFIDAYSDQVQLVDGPLGKKGRVLDLTIVDARAAGGGMYSGTKWLTVKGVLKENGSKIGSFTAKRTTVGLFNLGACSAARRCSKAVGKDIAAWLKDPKSDSTLGQP